jgi:hypothetical protein
MQLFQNFQFNYVYGVELLVILALALFLAYVWYALGVFKKR